MIFPFFYGKPVFALSLWGNVCRLMRRKKTIESILEQGFNVTNVEKVKGSEYFLKALYIHSAGVSMIFTNIYTKLMTSKCQHSKENPVLANKAQVGSTRLRNSLPLAELLGSQNTSRCFVCDLYKTTRNPP